MKTHMKRLLGFLILLALFSAPHLASAYYDPGVQRWINRDPLGELGFIVLQVADVNADDKWDRDLNPFDFIANDPENGFDPVGLQVSVPPHPRRPYPVVYPTDNHGCSVQFGSGGCIIVSCG